MHPLFKKNLKPTMKKLSMFLVAATMITFVACSGGKEQAEESTESTEATVSEAEKAVEQTAPATDTAAMSTDTAAKM